MIKILVVDDNRHFRERLKTLLAAFPEVEIVGKAGDGHEALSKAKELKPDVALVLRIYCLPDGWQYKRPKD